MADNVVPYPPAPLDVPPDLTRPSVSYRVRVFVVLSSLFLFAFLYLGLVVGSAYLCYWSFASLGSTESEKLTGRNVLREAAATDERLTRMYNNAVQQRQQGKIDDRKLEQILETDLLPPWRAQAQRLAQIRGLPSDEQRLVEQCSRSFQLQGESWELLSRAIRQNDRRLADQAQQKARESEQIGRQFSASAEQYYPRRASRKSDSGFWNIIAGILSGLLCLFLVKGFFKWQRKEKVQRLEVTVKDQPVLFAFIHRVCQDTRAPRPHRVYLTPDVNAAVFYHESLLSLILPTPKNLIIGLGLVNQLNLSEFKAVLAHEFGHFSQSSMKLGSYVYTSNRVIAELVFGRDWLDNLVAALRGVDIRIAVFAWAFTGVMWTLRKSLQGLFRVINFANSSLSRQMEFNADLVAVSVTGSDALIHGLARLDFATDSLGQAWSDLSAAADRHLFTRDLFYHQTRAAEHLRTLRKNPRLGEPPVLSEDSQKVVQVFQSEDTSVPKMWATHPSNYDREMNAKRHYVRSPIDERSPWILFKAAAAVREKITQQLYEATGQWSEVTLQDPQAVQAFIDEEHAETTYHPRYHGLYDHRYLTPGELDELLRSAPTEFAGPDQLAEAHARLFDAELESRMQTHQARQEEYRRVAPLAHGAVQLTGKDFQFRGVHYRAADAGRLLDQLKKEMDEDYEWMARLDRQAFLIHYSMARQIGEEAQRELEERYRFHLTVQAIHAQLSFQNQQVQATLRQLAGKRELTQAEYYGALNDFRTAHDMLRQALDAAHQLCLPPLINVTHGELLGPLLLNRPLIHQLSDTSNGLGGVWIGRFLEQLGEVLVKAQRIHFKSLGGILALQEKLAEQWSALARGPAGPSEEPGEILAGQVPSNPC
jgi:Zn-dependent protease with chaperone function